MNARSVMAHAILALGSLLLAYLVWTDEGTSAAVDEVTVFECRPRDLSAVSLALDDKDIHVELTRDGDELDAWVVIERHPERGEGSRERFAATDAIDQVLEQLAPLRARRSLGELGPEQLAEIGLDEPEGTLTLRCGDREESFTIGGRAYGSGDRYARAGDAVYLIGDERLEPIESAELRLMERRLHTFEWTEIAAVEVDAFERHKRLLQRNRLDEASAQWVDAERPDTRNELFGNWLGAYPRLRVQRYLEGEPGSDLEGDAPAPTSVMRLTFEGEGGEELGRLELSRVDASPAAYYARTETTRGWVRVPPSVAQAFEDDARPVLGLDPIDRTPEAAPEGTAAADDGSAAEGESAEGESAEGDAVPAPEGSADDAPPPGVPPHGASPHGAPPHGASPHGASPQGASPHGGVLPTDDEGAASPTP